MNRKLTAETRERRPSTLAQTLLAAIFLGSIGVTVVTLGIHPAPDKVTVLKDAAEVVSRETNPQTQREFDLAQQPSEQRGRVRILAGISTKPSSPRRSPFLMVTGKARGAILWRLGNATAFCGGVACCSAPRPRSEVGSVHHCRAKATNKSQFKI
jgi:hypothetical protein